MSLLIATGVTGKVGKAILDIPAIAARVNEWSRKKFGDEVFRLIAKPGSAEIEDILLNPLYRVTGWGFAGAFRPFPGAATFWVERWEFREGDDGFSLSTQVASRRFGVNNRFDRDR